MTNQLNLSQMGPEKNGLIQKMAQERAKELTQNLYVIESNMVNTIHQELQKLEGNNDFPELKAVLDDLLTICQFQDEQDLYDISLSDNHMQRVEHKIAQQLKDKPVI